MKEAMSAEDVERLAFQCVAAEEYFAARGSWRIEFYDSVLHGLSVSPVSYAYKSFEAGVVRL